MDDLLDRELCNTLMRSKYPNLTVLLFFCVIQYCGSDDYDR